VSTFVVDWLGRGGIAQTSAAWAIELTQRGHDVVVATRERRELVDVGIDAGCAVVAAGARSSVAAHRAVARSAARAIRERRPSCVVIQNYIIPALELPVYRAAREVGARIAFVVHDDRLHSRVAGSHVGLGALMRRSDDLVAHTHWVARGAGSRAGRSVRVIALPVQLGMLREGTGTSAGTDADAIERDHGGDLVGVHFGVLRRRYKGAGLVAQLAGGVDGWTFRALGVGAPVARPGLVSAPSYLDAADLVRLVGSSDAALLPYRKATQSGAVVLAQALGVVPIASAVGGIPEQITDAEDGVLITPGAGTTAWRDALMELRDDTVRKPMAAAARDRAWRAHERFVASILDLVT
jgi:glycosyltransferase involved in cell wall biosynthesis